MNISKTFNNCAKLSMTGHCSKNMSMNIKNPCCNFWTNVLQNKLRPIMTVMRMASGRGRSHFNVTDLMQPLVKHMKLARYPLKTYSNSLIKDKMSYLPACSYSGEMKMDCMLFEPVVTSKNISLYSSF